MASISCKEAASELLRKCAQGEPWNPELAIALAAPQCADALFRILIEGLADRFEPRLCDEYARIFGLILETISPAFQSGDLFARYQRIRIPRVCQIEPRSVVVLSRVTLGADIAITSVILDAVKRRFPHAAIYLAGSAQAAELFGRDPRVRHLDAPYARSGSIQDRLAAWHELTEKLALPNAIVVDPDSRMTQLGLLPVCEEERYFFFESRAFGADTDRNLGDLAAQWASQTFQVTAPQTRIAPPEQVFKMRRPCVTVSLGVGGNLAKSLPEPFEADLIRFLSERFAQVIVDRGFGPAESARVDRAIAGTGAQTFTGSFARFASIIGQSDCYVGYDSAGQHAAAALGIPLVTLFKGFVSDRMFARWQPHGRAPKQVVKIETATTPESVMASLASSFSRIV